MALNDFTGRSIDLFIMQGAKASGARSIIPGFAGNTGGKITTGVQKASQLFLLLFLTEKGSRRHEPEFGSTFLTRMRAGNANDSQLAIAFRDAAEDILEQQTRFKSANAPADEILVDIDLLSFVIPSPFEMALEIGLTTANGITRKVILPVSLAIK